MALAKDIARAAEKGIKTFRHTDLNATKREVKASPGKVHHINIINAHASAPRFVRLYDAPAAGVTVGTTTPKMTLRVPGPGSLTIDCGKGFEFASGITAAAGTAVGDTDVTAPAANDVMVHIGYV